ncbi:MAG: porin family protein [bacterium]|nr:porin family protein [bacterium]
MSRLTLSAPAAALCLLAFPACSSTTFQEPPRQSSRLEVLYGERNLDNDFDPIDEPDVLGATYMTFRDGELAGWEIGYQRVNDDDEVGSIDIDLEMNEIFGGGRYEFDVGHGPVHPYIGAGLSYLDAEVEASSGSLSGDIDDETLGIYAHAGVYVNVGGELTLGVDFRALFDADLEFGGVDTEGDYTQLAFTIGFGF